MNPSQTIQAFLDEVGRLDELATPGPWAHCYDGSSDWSLGLKEDPQNDRIATASEKHEYNPLRNFALIAHFRTAAPKMAKALAKAMSLIEAFCGCDQDDCGWCEFEINFKHEIAAILSGGEEGE